MKNRYNCPVCGYKEIEGNTCPNCDTDLFLMRSLAELPVSIPSVEADLNSTCVDTPLRASRTGWQVGVALLILMMGIGLGVLGSFLFLQPHFLTATVTPQNTVIKGDKTPVAIAQVPTNRQQPTQYTVKPGDNLTAIAENFCGKSTSWQVMLKANPQLKLRPNLINVGEVLKLPNCGG